MIAGSLSDASFGNAVDCASQPTSEIGDSKPHDLPRSHSRLPPRLPRRPPGACHHDRQDGVGGHRGLGVPAADGLRPRKRLAGHLHHPDRGLAGGAGDLPEKAVALHFDNGWLDARTVVMPILDELGATGTCYVISEPTDASSKGLPAGITTTTEGFVIKPFLTWDHCRELLDAGWEIGAHTATHPKLGQIYDSQGGQALMAEIVPSNAVFKDNLGCVPDHFAYPSGSRSDTTDALLSPHYRSLRRWTFDQPPVWDFTDETTSPKALVMPERRQHRPLRALHPHLRRGAYPLSRRGRGLG